MSDNYSHFTKSQQITLTELRQKLLSQGYKITPNLFKACKFPTWNTAAFVEKEQTDKKVASWERRYPTFLTTGILMREGAATLDVDVNDADGASAMSEAVTEIAPEVGARAPMRCSEGTHKFMLFCRVDLTEPDLIFKKTGRQFYRPDEVGELGKDHKIEAFGGGLNRHGKCWQVGAYGPRKAASNYFWDSSRPALHEVPLQDLPLITAKQFYAIMDAFVAWAKAAGWVEAPKPDTETGAQVYDIDENTRFDTDKGGEQITYEELCDEHAIYGDWQVRCKGTFIKNWAGSDRLDHCSVAKTARHNCVAVYVFGDGAMHYPVKYKPLSHEELAEALRNIRGAAPSETASERLGPAADIKQRTAWLLAHYGYCPSSHLVIELHRAEEACHRIPKAFAMEFRAWYAVSTGPRKGTNVHYATVAWEHNVSRVTLAGVRMRPGQPFPLYEERGQLYKNTYLRPVHKDYGDLAPFLAFMQCFLPDKTEREWFFDWMAHKLRCPEVPGSSVWFVADTPAGPREGRHGTGRGFMFRIGHKLYGEAYARAEDFDILSGASGQSVYTDWMHNCILVTIDEANTSKTGYRRGERRSVYEVLKNIIDPAAKRRRFKGKFKSAFDDLSYCSFWIATNHADAAAIPTSDRRMSVLRNGREMTAAEGIEMAAWIDAPGSMAVLSGFLVARDLSQFNMYASLETTGKAEMAEYAIGPIEEFVRDLQEDPHGLVFTRTMLETLVKNEFQDGHSWSWRGEFEAIWSRYCIAVKNESGNPRRHREGTTQRKLYCFRSDLAAVVRLPEAAFEVEAKKIWGHRDPSKGSHGMPGLKVVVSGKNEQHQQDSEPETL